MNILNLPEELIINEIIIHTTIWDIVNWRNVCIFTRLQTESIDIWFNYINKNSHNIINYSAIILSTRIDYFNMMKSYLISAKNLLDVVTLQQILISYSQLEFNVGIKFIMNYVKMLNIPKIEYLNHNGIKIDESNNIIHSNFLLDASILINVKKTNRAIEIIKSIGSDYIKWDSDPNKEFETFRAKNSQYLELINIDNGDKYSHSFYLLSELFVLHLISIIDRLSIDDYIWLFDSRTVLPKPLKYYDSEDEEGKYNGWGGSGDSDYSYSSESDSESNHDLPKKTSKNKYVNDIRVDRYKGTHFSNIMMLISKGVITALSVFGNKYKNEIMRCIGLVKSNDLKSHYLSGLARYSDYELFEILTNFVKIKHSDYYIWLNPRFCVLDTRIIEFVISSFLINYGIDEGKHFIKHKGPSFCPKVWVNKCLRLGMDLNILLGIIDGFYYDGYDVWCKKVINYIFKLSNENLKEIIINMRQPYNCYYKAKFMI